MQTIIDYLETEFASFEEKPFNPVDSLVLCAFCMVDLAHIAAPLQENPARHSLGSLWKSLRSGVPKSIRFKDVPHAELYPTMFTSPTPEKTKQLMFALAASPRFRAMKIESYLSLLDEESHTQFCAMTFVYKRKFAYIGFRGTDSTLTGWREDFDMAFTAPIPSQAQALHYVEALAPQLPPTLFLGGHSKGGNLAVYVALTAQDPVLGRIKRIYNHDGPGFKHGTFTPASYDLVRDRIDKTVPQDSLVGMLMQSQEAYRVVHSSGRGIAQHDPFTWEISGDDFVCREALADNARFTSEVINEWLGSLPPDELRIMTDTLFATLMQSEDVHVAEVLSDWRQILALVVGMGKDADKPTAEVLGRAVGKLSNIALKRFGEGISTTVAGRVGT
ncbi:MAG: Mbeg1-like protein [Raoultibacter sp.]